MEDLPTGFWLEKPAPTRLPGVEFHEARDLRKKEIEKFFSNEPSLEKRDLSLLELELPEDLKTTAETAEGL